MSDIDELRKFVLESMQHQGEMQRLYERLRDLENKLHKLERCSSREFQAEVVRTTKERDEIKFAVMTVVDEYKKVIKRLERLEGKSENVVRELSLTGFSVYADFFSRNWYKILISILAIFFGIAAISKGNLDYQPIFNKVFKIDSKESLQSGNHRSLISEAK